jgi:hypothetical protein
MFIQRRKRRKGKRKREKGEEEEGEKKREIGGGGEWEGKTGRDRNLEFSFYGMITNYQN